MSDKTKKRYLQIGAVGLIVLALVGIFLFKNLGDRPHGEQTSTKSSAASQGSTLQGTDALPFEADEITLETIKTYGMPTVIEFGSDSCAPCREMAPLLEKLYSEWQGRAVVQYIDVWANPEGAREFPISLIPTQAFFEAGGTPFVPSDDLKEEIEFILYYTKTDNTHALTLHQGGLTENQMRAILKEMGIDD